MAIAILLASCLLVVLFLAYRPFVGTIPIFFVQIYRDDPRGRLEALSSQLDEIEQMRDEWEAIWASQEARGRTSPCLASKDLQKESLYRGKTMTEWTKLLMDKDLKTRETAVAALIEAFQDKDVNVASAAADAVSHVGQEAVPRLIRAMNRPEPSIRAFSASALGYMHPTAKEAIAPLMRALNDKDSQVRWAAAMAFENIGLPAEEAIPALIRALKDPYHQTRDSAVGALRKMGSKAKPALPALIEALKDSNGNVRADAALALGEIGADFPAVVQALTVALKNREDDVARRAIAQALGRIGPGAKEAVPALLEALKERKKVDGRSPRERLLGQPRINACTSIWFWLSAEWGRLPSRPCPSSSNLEG
jgi:HEAT repeat protein